jgi:hypothetical protein
MVFKMAKNSQKMEGPGSEFQVVKITPKGINAVIKNVTLNWVFLATPAEDKNDPLRAQYRTQMILRGGEKPFIKEVETALKQYLKTASIAWGADVRLKVLNNALALDMDKGLFKTGEHGLSINAHQSVRRESAADEFHAKYPPAIRLQDNKECPAVLVTTEFYSGVIADVAVFIAAYEVEAGRGITIYLNGVRKVGNGERLASIDPFAGIEATQISYDDKKMLI